MDNNYLFLAMQTGGQLSPEQLQRAQQMGQLPQMNMGAGLNDIQKKNMAEAQHYNMFRKGGVPQRYAQGGEQEEIDQEYLSPYTQYNQRVSDFLQNLRTTSMNALQDEMVGVNDEYAEEADQIEMEQAQYGRQVSQPTVNPQGMAAVNSWMGAAQNTKDLTKPLAQTAGLASGLKGYFGGDQASYEANPYNSAWNPTRLTMTNNVTGEKTVTRAGRDGFFQPGGQSNGSSYFPPSNPVVGNLLQGTFPQRSELSVNIPYAQAELAKRSGQQYDAQTIANAKAMGWGDDVAGYTNSKFGYGPQHQSNLPKTTKKKGTATPAATTTAPAATTTAKTEEEKKKEEEQKKADEAKAKEGEKTTTETKTEEKTTPKPTGEVDYLATLADPTGQNAGGVYRTDRNGNPVPMAFYDPNMRLNTVTPTYRNNVASWLRGNKKHGQLKSVVYDFTSGAQNPATQVPSITGPNVPSSSSGVTLAPGVTRPDLMPQDKPADNFFETGLLPKAPESNEFSPLLPGQSPLPNPVPNQTNRFFPQAPQPTTGYPGGPFPATDNSWMDQQWKEAAANWRPGMQWNGPQNMLPSSIRQTPKVAPGSATQSMIAPSITPGMQNVFPYAPVTGPMQSQVQPQAPAPLSEQEKRQQLRQSGKETRRGIIEEANRKAAEEIQRAIQGYAYGGSLHKAQVGEEVSPANQGYDMGWAPIGQEKRAPEDRVSANVQMSQDFNTQKYGEPITINTPESNYLAKYDKNKKENPFFAPAMLAGLNVVAGATQNMDAKKKENELRGKLSYDQIYSANPETSGSRGDWTFNEGYMRPNDMVPTQFTGAGRQMQWGGAYSEGDELYLDEDAIQAFLAAGGQLDYLD
jgi:hypothetical protein